MDSCLCSSVADDQHAPCLGQTSWSCNPRRSHRARNDRFGVSHTGSVEKVEVVVLGLHDCLSEFRAGGDPCIANALPGDFRSNLRDSPNRVTNWSNPIWAVGHEEAVTSSISAAVTLAMTTFNEGRGLTGSRAPVGVLD